MKTHHYQITIQETEDRHGAVPGGAQALCFAAESHDDWDDIVRRIKQQALFDEASATQFAIGLKLLGGACWRTVNIPCLPNLRHISASSCGSSRGSLPPEPPGKTGQWRMTGPVSALLSGVGERRYLIEVHVSVDICGLGADGLHLFLILGEGRDFAL